MQQAAASEDAACEPEAVSAGGLMSTENRHCVSIASWSKVMTASRRIFWRSSRGRVMNEVVRWAIVTVNRRLGTQCVHLE